MNTSKVKKNFFNQYGENSLTKEEKTSAKLSKRIYETININFFFRNHQKSINEIRDVINKYGENAKIHLGGIPMIADDMMTFIKNDIIVFGFGVFVFIILTLLVNIHLENIKMGNHAVAWLCNISDYDDQAFRLGGMGMMTYSNFIICYFIALMLILNK